MFLIVLAYENQNRCFILVFSEIAFLITLSDEWHRDINKRLLFYVLEKPHFKMKYL